MFDLKEDVKTYVLRKEEWEVMSMHARWRDMVACKGCHKYHRQSGLHNNNNKTMFHSARDQKCKFGVLAGSGFQLGHSERCIPDLSPAAGRSLAVATEFLSLYDTVIEHKFSLFMRTPS